MPPSFAWVEWSLRCGQNPDERGLIVPDIIVQIVGRDKLPISDEVKAVLGVEPGDKLVFVVDGTNVKLRRHDRSSDPAPIESVETTEERTGGRTWTGKGKIA